VTTTPEFALAGRSGMRLTRGGLRRAGARGGQETGGDVWKIALGMAALAAMTAAILSSATQLRSSWK
jgi:hypothetical protein